MLINCLKIINVKYRLSVNLNISLMPSRFFKDLYSDKNKMK